MKFAIILVFVFVLCLMESESRSAVTSFTSSQSLDTKDKELCEVDTTPCGWEIYHPVSRNRLHIVQNNSCKCGPEYKCIKAQDDIAQSTFIYKCREAFPSNLT